MENASACLCLHKWPIFRIFTVSSSIPGQLNKLSAKVLKICTKCAYRTLYKSHDDTELIKNVLFCLFCFPKVVQKQTSSKA